MKIFNSIYCILIFIITFSCNPNSGSENVQDQNFGTIRNAKGYYQEGDKKYKIFSGGIFRLNESASFKSLFPISIKDAISSRIALQVYEGLVKLNQRTLKVEPFAPHDLRRSGSSHMTGNGIPRETVQKILNHVERGITKVYDRYSYDQEKKNAMIKWDRILTRVINGEMGKIVQMRSK